MFLVGNFIRNHDFRLSCLQFNLVYISKALYLFSISSFIGDLRCLLLCLHLIQIFFQIKVCQIQRSLYYHFNINDNYQCFYEFTKLY